MHINIFDSGLNGMTGHHFDFCLNFGKHLAQRGHSVSIWGGRDASAELPGLFAAAGCRFSPLFTHLPITLEQHQMVTFQDIEKSVKHTAAQLCSSEVPQGLNFFPTLKPTELLAFSHAERAGAMAGMVHTLPGIHSAYSANIWSTACANVLRRGLSVKVGVIEPVLAGFLRTYSGKLPIETCPFPLDGTSARSHAARPQSIGFFGNQRDERGLAVIPPLVERLLAQGYRVVVHDTRGQFNTNGTNVNLSVLNGFLPDLGAVVAQCDMVVCPARWESYALRPSGIVAMAIACGVPCIAASGTLSAATHYQHGSIVCYHELSVEGILQAIARMTEDYPHFAECARVAAQIWQKTQGMEKAVAWLLAAENSQDGQSDKS
ncbi:MAG TPA: hypothetical protein VIF60_20245 [Burkholderiaceae bacterium]